MAEDEVAEAVSTHAGKMRRHFKRARRELKSTGGDVGETLKAAQKLQVALQSVKPVPKPDAKLADVANKAGKQQELATLQQALRRYAEARDDTSNRLSPRGQRRWMLTQLIKMTEMSVNQHTGGGESGSGSSRRESRQIMQALKQLRSDEKRLHRAGKLAMPRLRVPLDLGDDAPVSAVGELVTALKLDDKQLKKTQLVFKKNCAATEDHVDELVQALG